jgi:hypothetical protein
MYKPDNVQPQLPIGLEDQISILIQLYDLALKLIETRVELECTWHILAQEEDN